MELCFTTAERGGRQDVNRETNRNPLSSYSNTLAYIHGMNSLNSRLEVPGNLKAFQSHGGGGTWHTDIQGGQFDISRSKYSLKVIFLGLIFARNDICGSCKDSRYNSDISRYQI